MRNTKVSLIAIIAVLAGITVFCVYKYIVSVRENNVLSASIRQLNSQVNVLEEEKNSLTLDLGREKELKEALDRENSGLKGDLSKDEERLARLETDFEASRKAIDDLNTKFSLVKAENRALRGKVQDLEVDFSEAKADKEQLAVRLNSIDELKKAIKELRQKARLAKRQVREQIEQKEVMIMGNNGFVVKNGMPTSSAKIKIEVQPQPGS